MDIRSAGPLVRLPFCPARGVDAGVVSNNGEGVGAGESGGLCVFKVLSKASLLSFGVTWIFGTSGSFESMMRWTCSSHTSDLGRDDGFSLSGVSKTLMLL